jgi:hypothetical protein
VEGGAGVSPSEPPAYLAPALFMLGVLSVVCFCISCHPQSRFLEQASMGCESFVRKITLDIFQIFCTHL